MSTRAVVLTGAALVGASTAATSSVSLYQLAQLCGIPGFLAAALPIALDAGAGVAALVWITEKGTLREWGRWLAIASLVASLVGNGIQHAITSELLDVTLPLVLLVGACIPACLWATIHLAALMVKPPRQAAPKPHHSRASLPVRSETGGARGPRPSAPPAAAADPTPPKPPVQTPDDLAEARRAKEREKKRRQREAKRAQAEAAGS